MTAPPSLSNNLADAPSNVAELVASNNLPTTFHGDALLYGVNLGLMTTFTCLGVIVVGWLGMSLFAHRKYDLPLDPVTLYRGSWLCAGIGLTIRCGAQAAALWAWDPKAAKTAAAVLTVQRYLDPLSLVFAAGWLVLLTLSYPAMISQLRKRPYPVEMLSRLPSLKRPALVVLMSFAAAALVAWLKASAGVA